MRLLQRKWGKKMKNGIIWDLKKKIPKLSGRSFLLIGGWGRRWDAEEEKDAPLVYWSRRAGGAARTRQAKL